MKYGYVLAAMLLAACSSHAPVPVVDRGAPPPEPAPAPKAAVAVPVVGESVYTVKKGDTLYTIALEHGQDYKDVAAWNGIDNPNRIQVGQQLRMRPADPDNGVVVKPVLSSAPVEARPAGANSDTFKREPKGGTVPYSDQALARMRETQPAPVERPVEKVEEKPAAAPAPAGDDAVEWAWPAAGKTLAGFSEGGAGTESNKGIDILGKLGDPVQAAAAGKVTYVGTLRGYGDFVVLRHNKTFLSVYGHNSKILVKEGQDVAKGQKIAEVGSSDADRTKLHFEIRVLGKPVDPAKYLPPR